MKVYTLKHATPKMKYQHMRMVMDFKRELMEAAMPKSASADTTHYWYIQRRKKRSKGWQIVRDFQATKAEAARMFTRWYRDGQHRLKHVLSYSDSTIKNDSPPTDGRTA